MRTGAVYFVTLLLCYFAAKGVCQLMEYSDNDDEDEAAELMRELEKIKRERQEQREKEVRLSFCRGCRILYSG